eukprot:CAMPEP_0179129468 /NCGR_PEP_ID=MMETSP0796-20121207/61430_1 /TAXON_ID=73915 /ORGANISM="Pyrodinium bahamense, Strain pbaha01" /LENGTH=199 /DNA_ID=CAMNT_0020828349 /DNA_START=350 /DNA_END=945 /DNA_ORIENTATION=-
MRRRLPADCGAEGVQPPCGSLLEPGANLAATAPALHGVPSSSALRGDDCCEVNCAKEVPCKIRRARTEPPRLNSLPHGELAAGPPAPNRDATCFTNSGGHSTARNAGVTPGPAPGREELAAPLEFLGQLVAETGALGCVIALRPPAPDRLALLLALEAGAWPQATDVGRRPLQVVEARRGDVEVRLASAAAVAPGRAAV